MVRSLWLGELSIWLGALLSLWLGALSLWLGTMLGVGGKHFPPCR